MQLKSIYEQDQTIHRSEVIDKNQLYKEVQTKNRYKIKQLHKTFKVKTVEAKN